MDLLRCSDSAFGHSLRAFAKAVLVVPAGRCWPPWCTDLLSHFIDC